MLFLTKGVLSQIVHVNQKSDHMWRAYKTHYAGYTYYMNKLNKLKDTRDGLNVALHLLEHVEDHQFDNSEDDEELAAMNMPATKKLKYE